MKKAMFILSLLCICTFSLFSAAAERELPVMTLTLGTRKVQAEIAVSESDSSRGLMGRKSMPQNHGMLFVFNEEKIASFWMKNTLIPLDIAFIDQEGAITQIERMEVPLPGKEPAHYRSHTPVRYALEMNADWFKRNQVAVGTKIPELARKQRGEKAGEIP